VPNEALMSRNNYAIIDAITGTGVIQLRTEFAENIRCIPRKRKPTWAGLVWGAMLDVTAPAVTSGVIHVSENRCS